MENSIINGFSVAHLNIRSMNTGFDEFLNYIHDNSFDILGLSETWLNPEHNTSYFDIPGYTFIRKDRVGRGGGVGIYLRKSIKFTIYDFTFPSQPSPDLEYVACKTKIQNKTLCILNMYRAPSSNLLQFFDTLEDLFSLIVPVFDHVIFLGDINIDFLQDTATTRKLKTLLEAFNLAQHVVEPTRFNHLSNNGSLIDIIITNKNFLPKNTFSVIMPESITDHHLVYSIFDLPKARNSAEFVTLRDYKNLNFELFTHDFNQINWNNLYNAVDVDEKTSIFNNNLLLLLNKHAPLIKRKIYRKPFTPWITPNIKLLMKQRDKAYKKYHKNKNPASLQYYRELRNYTKHAIIREKTTYFNQISQQSGKDFWQNAKKLNLTQKSSIIDLPDHLKNAELINNHFLSSNTRNLDSLNKTNFYLSTRFLNFNLETELNFKLIDRNQVQKILQKIKSNAEGEDGITLLDLQTCLPFCLDPLVHIINSCILDNSYPKIWKKSIIKPIPKTQVPKDYNDLRPISIIPTISKILETHIFEQICEFSTKYKIIPDCQSGFRKNFSTTTCLVNIINSIRFNEEQKENTCLALLDFSKAFDTVHHKLLVAKLSYFGFSQNSVNFLKSYLANRQCSVSLKNKDNNTTDKSSFIPVTQGVPQGSILSPLLFSLYVADMHKCTVYSTLHQYADDSQLVCSFASDELKRCQEKLNTDLNNIHTFADEHNLKLNSTKSQILVFNPSKINREPINFQAHINNIPIPVVKEAKNLGIIFDNALTFSAHLQKKTTAAYLRLKQLYKVARFLPSKTKYLLCNSLILSLFDYGDAVYGDSLTLKLQKQIQKVQNSCMRFAYNIPFRQHITPHLNAHNILNMKNRRKYHMYMLIYRIVKNEEPLYLKNHLVSMRNPNNTRNHHLFNVPAHRTNNFQKSFSYVSANLWNNLSNDLKNSSPKIFSKQIKSMLLQEQMRML